MENTKQNKAIIALGALGYLINVHIENPTLKRRLLARLAEAAEYFEEPLMEDYTEEFQTDVNEQAKMDYEDLHGKEEV